MNLLNKKICDHRLTDLIRKMFNCRILAPLGFYFKNNLGVPQGNVISPLLCNVYLHEFDVFMETLKIKYHKGKYLAPNPEYFKKVDLSKYVRILYHELQDRIRRGNRRQLFNKGIKPYLHDDNYIRLKYIRFAYDLLIGARGSKKIAEKIKTESNNWLEMNLHLKFNEKKTSLTYGIGNKIKFLGFYLFHVPYNQLPSRNSRRMEKIKRMRNRILARKEEANKRIQKRLKIDLIKIIKKKLEISANLSTKFILNEIGEAFAHNLKNQVKKEDSYRDILNKLVSNISDDISSNTNDKIKKVLTVLSNPHNLESTKTIFNPDEFSAQRNSTLIPKTPLSEAEFVRRITSYLQKENYEHYRVKNKIKFDKNIIHFMKSNNINLAYYPSNLELSEAIKKQLIKCSKDKPVKEAVVTNYKIIIKYIWDKQNKLDSISSMTVDQSKSSKSNINILETKQGSRISSPIQIKTNWDSLNKRLIARGFLNQKGRPSSVSRLTTLSVPEIIKYFNSIIHGFLFYYRCSDDFNRDKKRLHWVFKYSLVSTIKMKLKLGSRVKVFDKYGSAISCLDKNNNKVSFLPIEVLNELKKSYLIDNVLEDVHRLMNSI